MIKVFVYGTLKPGEANYQSYCEGKVRSHSPAYTQGNLYSLPVGYPAMTTGDNRVKGVLLTFDNANVLKKLDELEGYQEDRPSELNEYDRLLVPVYGLNDEPLGQAWCYFMTVQRVQQYRGTMIPSGWWESVRSSSREVL